MGRASVMTGIFLGLIVAMIWLWRWIGTHELEIRRWWEELADRRWVLAFRKHFGWRIDWLLEKLSMQGYLALCLTIGVLLLFGLTAFFRGPNGGLQHLFAEGDLQVARWFEHRSALVINLVAPEVARLGSVGWLTLVSLLAALALVWRGRISGLLFLLLTGWLGSGLAFLLEEIFARRLPEMSETFLDQRSGPWLLHLDLFAATIIYAAVSYLIVRTPLTWRWRALVVLVTILVLLVLALSGLYLRQYLLSDVFFVILTGAAWVFVCIGTIETLAWRNRAASKRRRLMVNG
jgi:hypothetical protein